MNSIENKLISRILFGEIDAFRELLNLYEHKVYHFCKKLVYDSHLAEDITQDTFLAVYRNLHQYDQKKPFSTWLFAIAKHRAYRVIKNIGKLQMDMSIDEVVIPDPKLDVIDQVIAEEEKLALLDAIDRLKSSHKDVILLKYFSEMSYKEIAVSLSISEKKVENRLYAAKKTLNRLIADKDERLVEVYDC